MTPPSKRKTAKPRRRCNDLDGRRWLQNSISVWSDIRKTPEEARLNHPAMFPGMLVARLIETFLPPQGKRILDPFAGSGSTVVAAERMGKCGIGLELSPEYVELARRRLARARQQAEPFAAEEASSGQPPSADPAGTLAESSDNAREHPDDEPCNHQPERSDAQTGRSRRAAESVVHCAPVARLRELVPPDSIDLCITSPPYWDILQQRRTADMKAVRHYGDHDGDLGRIGDYGRFLDAVAAVFADVLVTLKPGAYCCLVVMDLRKKSRFYPLHSDLARRLQEAGYLFDDLIIWNRQSEYNNLRPLGYPSVFRVNKVHEFIVVLQKPRP